MGELWTEGHIVWLLKGVFRLSVRPRDMMQHRRVFESYGVFAADRHRHVLLIRVEVHSLRWHSMLRDRTAGAWHSANSSGVFLPVVLVRFPQHKVAGF